MMSVDNDFTLYYYKNAIYIRYLYIGSARTVMWRGWVNRTFTGLLKFLTAPDDHKRC
jgi:hypothetical protein